MSEQYLPAFYRDMTISDAACALIGAREAIDAYDAMRDRTTDERVAEFKTAMNRLRALVGLGSDPIEEPR